MGNMSAEILLLFLECTLGLYILTGFLEAIALYQTQARGAFYFGAQSFCAIVFSLASAALILSWSPTSCKGAGLFQTTFFVLYQMWVWLYLIDRVPAWSFRLLGGRAIYQGILATWFPMMMIISIPILMGKIYAPSDHLCVDPTDMKWIITLTPLVIFIFVLIPFMYGISCETIREDIRSILRACILPGGLYAFGALFCGILHLLILTLPRWCTLDWLPILDVSFLLYVHVIIHCTTPHWLPSSALKKKFEGWCCCCRNVATEPMIMRDAVVSSRTKSDDIDDDVSVHTDI